MDEIKSRINQTAVDQEALESIGRITANFAILETKLTKLIYFLLGTDEETALIVASEKSFSGLQDLAMALIIKHVKCETIEPEVELKFRSISKMVSEAEQKRNVIAHSLWGFGGKQGLTIRTKYTAKRKKGLSFQREEMTSADFDKISDQISVSAFEVGSICSLVRQQLTENEFCIPGIEKSKLAVL